MTSDDSQLVDVFQMQTIWGKCPQHEGKGKGKGKRKGHYKKDWSDKANWREKGGEKGGG